ncbi:MAG: four helix bundle protein [Bacteroidales bacterium]|nr:four helix bundle protein [Bacteroidales bacterium]
MSKNYHGFKDLFVYQKAFKLSMDILQLTKFFPKEEKYSLTDQVRRSSRSVGANLAEAWAKRRYVKSFVAKLIDSQGESFETTHWLDTAIAAKYMDQKKHNELSELNLEVQKMLESMINNPDKFCQ